MNDAFVTKNFSLKQHQLEYIESINKDNVSSGLQMIINQHMKQRKSQLMDKLLLNISIGGLLIGVGLIQVFWYTAVVFYGMGTGSIIFGYLYYREHRSKMV